jgi:hypothetical protein
LAKKTKIKVAKSDIDSATQHVFVTCLKTYAPNHNYGKDQKKKKSKKGSKVTKNQFLFLVKISFLEKLKIKKTLKFKIY